MRSDRLRYILYIYAGVLPVIMSKVYIYRYMYRIHKMCVCVCVERQLSTKGMHMYTIVKIFKMEKKALFDGRDYEKLWIASIIFFFYNISEGLSNKTYIDLLKSKTRSF